MMQLPRRTSLVLAGAALCGAAAYAADTMPTVDGSAILAHVKILASDEFEGRAPGTKGEDLTVKYLVDEFQKLRLKPGNTDGTFIQKVPLVGITPDPATALTFKKGAQAETLKFKDDFVAWTKHVADSASLDDSELVFVGYGVEAPEFKWDDYKGVDVKGKTIVVLINDPPLADSKLFGGKAMTYYGRWTYKFETGAKKGARGILIVHETEPAGYPFGVIQSSSGERFDLATPDKNMWRASVEGWISLDRAKQLFAMAGQDFDALKARAATREFKPVPLGVTASVQIRNTLRTLDSRNVVAKLEGSDPKLKDEYVVYTAHWDHLGVGPEVKGDKIYNGAQDNASGTAARDRDRPGVHQGVTPTQAVDPVPCRHGRRTGAARLAVLLCRADLPARRRRSPTSTWTVSGCAGARRTSSSSGWERRIWTTISRRPRPSRTAR